MVLEPGTMTMTKKELTTKSATLFVVVALASTTLEHKKQRQQGTLCSSLSWPLTLQVWKKRTRTTTKKLTIRSAMLFVIVAFPSTTLQHKKQR
jgi:BarA-like signal transduction histidine kinase